MTSLCGLSTGELAAFVSDHLRRKRFDVVLVGGACICIYSENACSSYDLDFITTGIAGRQSIRQALGEIGFTEEQRYFRHPETDYFIEFPSGPLAIGVEAPGEIATRSYLTCKHVCCQSCRKPANWLITCSFVNWTNRTSKGPKRAEGVYQHSHEII